MYTFEVYGKIKGKARPRFSRRGGFVTTYTPSDTAQYEKAIAGVFVDKYGVVKTDKPVVISIDAYFQIPKSTSKRKKAEMLVGEILPTKKPDCDNIIKIVLDALNDVAYIDDKQVIKVSLCKMYAEEEYLQIKLYEY
ncbi:MAG: RusA family crossover junction endodeoxyribonuclease [bacterium]|nr:RusA family crossover junction endodeoxyribonuclease [bacterium]